MKQPVFPAILLSLLLGLAGCQSSEPAVVTVDMDRVLTQSKAALAANEHLARVQDILQQAMNAYQTEILKAPANPELSCKKPAAGKGSPEKSEADAAALAQQQQADLQKGLLALRQQLAREQAAARSVVEQHMLAQIAAWQADKKSVVVARQNVLSAPAALDITADIIARMDAAGPVRFADLPKVHIRSRNDAAQTGGEATAGKTSGQ